MTDLPKELRDRAARAAADAMHDVVMGPGEPPLADRDFGVAIVGWRAVVDAVAEVLAPIRTTFSDGEWHNAYRRLSAEVGGIADEVDQLEAERDELKARLAEGAAIVRRLIAKEPSPEEWERAVRRGQEIYRLLNGETS